MNMINELTHKQQLNYELTLSVLEAKPSLSADNLVKYVNCLQESILSCDQTKPCNTCGKE